MDEEKKCDFIAYAIPDINACYLLPFQILRLVMQRCLPMWKATRPTGVTYPVIARNQGYDTVSVGIEWRVLVREIGAETRRAFESGKLIGLVRSPEGQLTFSVLR